MGLRPAVCYREVKGPSYTRTAKKVMKKAFITGVPGSKLRLYDMGLKKLGKSAFEYELTLISKEPMQLRHNQLEAARVAANKHLTTKAAGEYYFKIRTHPHHVLRENKLATGAGADRFSQGMRNGFGKPIGVAARVKNGTKIMSIYVGENRVEAAKQALKKAAHKLSCKTTIDVHHQKVDTSKASQIEALKQEALKKLKEKEEAEEAEKTAAAAASAEKTGKKKEGAPEKTKEKKG